MLVLLLLLLVNSALAAGQHSLLSVAAVAFVVFAVAVDVVVDVHDVVVGVCCLLFVAIVVVAVGHQ